MTDTVTFGLDKVRDHHKLDHHDGIDVYTTDATTHDNSRVTYVEFIAEPDGHSHASIDLHLARNTQELYVHDGGHWFSFGYGSTSIYITEDQARTLVTELTAAIGEVL